ncbi:tetratricopeptide repeat protein [Paeniglutamicibacter sulfureus]|uniref:NACHT domain-containing protein n=1 Tax=Paeniglutamicibacter sulfureus TaxID=43666 RepID=A0ABU2BF44_9MICC|nr:tetratricopeptide repeat protein [Paeniglutamicibacter sulfureus]MDR7357260.1 hypothetical protein [Paeniglutamicibacter sulfureus]
MAMSSRHALVVGSQCAALRNQRLSFLPQRAQHLHRALTDPRLGDCDPANSALVLDPTMAELKEAVMASVTRASEAKATLVFAFIGHAEINKNKVSAPLFLLPKDGNHKDLDDDTAYEIGRRLGNMALGSLDGLILILDVCHAGLGVADVIKNGLDLREQVRLELLAGTYDREARNGCFSQSLITLMESGQPDSSVDYLDIRHAANFGNAICRKEQDPPVYIGSGAGTNASDPGLWVTRNIAAPNFWPLSGTPEGALAVTLTNSFQVTHDLERITFAMSQQRLVVIHGRAGSGKSALLAALARPELVPDLPRRYLSAVAFTTLTPTLSMLAASIAKQLGDISGFAAATVAHSGAFDKKDLDRQPALQRLVFGPLRQLKVPLGKRIRVAIDGVDQLEPVARGELMSVIAQACVDERLERVSILVNTRGEGIEGLPGQSIRLARPGEDEISEYLAAKGLPGSVAADLAANSSTWLEAGLLTEAILTLGPDVLKDAASLDDIYQKLLSSLVDEEMTDAMVCLTVLAAAGSGPVLPLHIAVEASLQMGGPGDELEFRNTLARLGGLVARANPGTANEIIGFFHDTLVQKVRHQGHWPITVRHAHQAILEAIEVVGEEASRNYSRERAADHLWALGRYHEALSAVISSLGHRAADNRELLQEWLERASGVLPVDEVIRLNFMDRLALWTGKSGDISAALTQSGNLLRDRLRVLGPDDPATLTARHHLAFWTGQLGDASEALVQFSNLLLDQVRVLGADHPATLKTRSNVATWTGRTGDIAAAIMQNWDLFQDRLRVMGEEHPDTLKVRSNLATWTGKSGDVPGALAQFRSLLEVRIRVLGEDHPDTLKTRSNVASWAGKSGDIAGALEQFLALLEARIRVLGEDHPATLSARSNVASWTGKSGDRAGAVTQFHNLLGDRLRVLGPNHPATLKTRRNLAAWTK